MRLSPKVALDSSSQKKENHKEILHFMRGGSNKEDHENRVIKQLYLETKLLLT